MSVLFLFLYLFGRGTIPITLESVHFNGDCVGNLLYFHVGVVLMAMVYLNQGVSFPICIVGGQLCIVTVP